MEITLQLFGAFRPLGKRLSLSLPDGAVVSDIRKALLVKIHDIDNNFNKTELIDSSRFANDDEILDEESLINELDNLAILPPVSGG